VMERGQYPTVGTGRLELKTSGQYRMPRVMPRTTAVHVPGAGQGGYGVGAGYGTPGASYAGPPRVHAGRAAGKEMEFYDIAKAVYDMWTTSPRQIWMV